MGSPENEEDRETNEAQVRASLRGFWMGETEVTQRQWEAVMSTRPWEIGEKEIVWEGIENKPDVPANYVSCDDAVAFCKALTKQQQAIGKLAKECEFVLPTEAQWEYACRAGTSTAFCFGNDPTNLSKYAWSDGSLKSVGLLKPNNWGLFDMHGNVGEWCLDSYSFEDSRTGGFEPLFVDSEDDSFLVTKGGNWIRGADDCRCASRLGQEKYKRSVMTGFRLTLQHMPRR